MGVALGLAVALMVVASIAGRAAWARPVPGDVELTQFGIAFCISLSLPWAQVRGANIIVDFFTQRSGPRTLRGLDGAGALLMAVFYALLAWRSAAGALAVWQAHEASMILDLPMWWVYAGLVPGLALAAAVALRQAALQWRVLSP
ncbi:MAG: TRAP transporter small permease [Betaproteobacteria bacterium]|jgi:TRAP-type C4-dicarboxylate transport system permease small subunit